MDESSYLKYRFRSKLPEIEESFLEDYEVDSPDKLELQQCLSGVSGVNSASTCSLTPKDL